jgi:plastocyanin
MKKFIGLFIVVIALVLISGCTQPAQPAAVITPVATAVPTVPPTVPPTIATPAPTVMLTTVATVISTPKITLVPQIKNTIFYMRNNTFVPTELTVLPGTGITWVNEDSIVHSVKITGIHAGTFNSGDIIPGATAGNTFATEGVFEFISPDHPDMKGTIVVKAGASVEGAPPMQTPSK